MTSHYCQYIESSNPKEKQVLVDKKADSFKKLAFFCQLPKKMSDAPKNYKLKKLNFESHQNEGVSKK